MPSGYKVQILGDCVVLQDRNEYKSSMFYY